MASIIVLIGISGSGKSTISNYLSKIFKANIVSSDETRELLWGNAEDQRNPSKIFEYMDNATIKDLNAGINVIYDATNLLKGNRINLINKIRAAAPFTEFRCVVVDTPLEMCIAQNSGRERKVPESVIRNQLIQFRKNPISYDEGWDKIDFTHSGGQFMRLLKSVKD